MTTTPAEAPLNPITAALLALKDEDSALGALAEVRETFGEGTRVLWDVGISRYLKWRWDTIVNDYFKGDAQAASNNMDQALAHFDVKETVHRACAVSDDALMMEVLAYAMALATVEPGKIRTWRRFSAIIDHLHDELLAKATT